jgi:hypothetical protein
MVGQAVPSTKPIQNYDESVVGALGIQSRGPGDAMHDADRGRTSNESRV